MEIRCRKKILGEMTQSVGIYLPPFKLARIKEELHDETGEDAQRLEWERLRKSLKGLVNKVNTSNIKSFVQELFAENLVKGRGLFVRSILHAQIASPIFSNVFAALVGVINAKIPEIGDLLLRRLILQFRRAYTRSDEVLLSCVCKFLAHLFNQRIISEVVILQVVTIFLEKLSSDSMKICCQLLFECGATLSEVSSKGVFFIFERLRQVLQEGLVEKRVQYMIESLFEARRNKFVSYPAISLDLDLVSADDQTAHEVDVIEGEIEGEEHLNIFTPIDAETFVQEAEDWRIMSREILGIAEGQEEEVYEEDEGIQEAKVEAERAAERIADFTEQDLINLRKTIYLAIMSSANFEECVHKILSLKLRHGQEQEVVSMLIESCAMEKTTNRFFHLQSERLCRLSRVYKSFFEEAFGHEYDAMHRHETSKIRNIGKLYSHLLANDAVSWDVLRSVRLTEEDTNASTRIFLKVLCQDLSENMGMEALTARVHNERFAGALSGIFPSTNVVHMRFSVNFFTFIGLGSLTSDLRLRITELTVQAKPSRSRSPAVVRPTKEEPEEEVVTSKRPREPAPAGRRGRSRSYSRSVPREKLTVIGRSRSPSLRRRRRRSDSRDRRRRQRSRSVDSFGRRRRH
jgi:pre-mRNA-splicing factor CWC22